MPTTEDKYTTLEELGGDIFICKALWQHDWASNPSPKHVDSLMAAMATWIIPLRCKRCKRERYEYLDSRGIRLGKPRYVNPVGYPKTHKFTGDELRAELIRRDLLVKQWSNGKP